MTFVLEELNFKMKVKHRTLWPSFYPHSQLSCEYLESTATSAQVTKERPGMGTVVIQREQQGFCTWLCEVGWA